MIEGVVRYRRDADLSPYFPAGQKVQIFNREGDECIVIKDHQTLVVGPVEYIDD